MNFHTTNTPYGDCVIGSNDTLSTKRLVKGYMDASRVMLCKKPMLLTYSNDIDKSFCLYDGLYLVDFSPDRVLLQSLLFNDVFCDDLLDQDMSQLTSSQFDEFALSLHNPSKLDEWSEKGLMSIVLPLQPQFESLKLSDNLSLSSPTYLPKKRWSNTCCLDFDGVISQFGVKDEGKPVEGVLEGIEHLIASGWHIEIYSGRSRSPSGIQSLRDWLEASLPSLTMYLWTGVIKLAEHKPTAKMYIDDRAIQFLGWSEITPSNLYKFRAIWQHPASTE